MSYIHDPALVELFGCKCKQTRIADDDGSDVETEHRQTGKWLNADVPKSGWITVGVYNVDYLSHEQVAELEAECETIFADPDDPISRDPICQMCECAHIKFLHKKMHPEFPHPLIVGCTCSGLMSDDMDEAREQEKHAKAIERAARGRAKGLEIMRHTVREMMRSDRMGWDEDDWYETDPEWRAKLAENRRKGRAFVPSVAYYEAAGYWMAIYRVRSGGCGSAIGVLRRNGDRGREIQPRREFRGVEDAKRSCAASLRMAWRRKLDSNLMRVINRNRIVNSLGELIPVIASTFS